MSSISIRQKNVKKKKKKKMVKIKFNIWREHLSSFLERQVESFIFL